ncbi:hypothetical protein ACVMB3_007293 [Sinorhizobium meliloti]
MKLIVNGEALDVAAETLSELLVLMEYEGDWLATEPSTMSWSIAKTGSIVRSTTMTRSKSCRRCREADGC